MEEGARETQPVAVRTWVGRRLKDLFKINTYLDTLPSTANRRTRALWPVVLHKHVILDALRRDLESLGLERSVRELPTLSAHLKASGNGETEPPP